MPTYWASLSLSLSLSFSTAPLFSLHYFHFGSSNFFSHSYSVFFCVSHYLPISLFSLSLAPTLSLPLSLSLSLSLSLFTYPFWKHSHFSIPGLSVCGFLLFLFPYLHFRPSTSCPFSLYTSLLFLVFSHFSLTPSLSIALPLFLLCSCDVN